MLPASFMKMGLAVIRRTNGQHRKRNLLAEVINNRDIPYPKNGLFELTRLCTERKTAAPREKSHLLMT